MLGPARSKDLVKPVAVSCMTGRGMHEALRGTACLLSALWKCKWLMHVLITVAYDMDRYFLFYIVLNSLLLNHIY